MNDVLGKLYSLMRECNHLELNHVTCYLAPNIRAGCLLGDIEPACCIVRIFFLLLKI